MCLSVSLCCLLRAAAQAYHARCNSQPSLSTNTAHDSTTPRVVLPALPVSTLLALTKLGLYTSGRARPLHVRLRRAGRHCHCLEKQPSTRTHNTPSHGLTRARVAHGRRGCRLPMQGLRRGMHRHARILRRARLLTRPVAQILEEGKAFELGMYLKCLPIRIETSL